MALMISYSFFTFSMSLAAYTQCSSCAAAVSFVVLSTLGLLSWRFVRDFFAEPVLGGLEEFQWNDGFCYLREGGISLGAFPLVSVAREWNVGGTYVEVAAGAWHPSPPACDSGRTVWEIPPTHRLGAAPVGSAMAAHVDVVRAQAELMVRLGVAEAADATRWCPTYRSAMAEVSRLVNPLALELPRRPKMPRFPRPAARRSKRGDVDGAHGHAHKRGMDRLSAMEAAKLLTTGMDSLGSAEERATVALDTFTEGVVTSVAPSHATYARLTSMLGPLRYVPRVEGHKEAATIRRAAMDHAARSLVGAVVGLVSPSYVEMHTFPRAAVWLYTDSLDGSRRSKHCPRCAAPSCQVMADAEAAGRVHRGNDWQGAARLFAHFEVSSLVLVNIEPNINASTLTDLMVRSGVGHALSLTSVDWRVLLGRKVHDTLIDMTTELAFGKVVSSFQDGGDYVQSLSNVKQMFAPTYSSGSALRRTVIFGNHATQYYELTLSAGAWATRCLPGHDTHYFVRLILPDLSRPVVLVEKKGMDRLLATYRTQAVKGRDNAMIVLRQSVVTYSISGTQVTPRIALSATEAEALAAWIVVYSDVQDALAERHMAAMRPGTAMEAAKATLYASVSSRLKASAPGVMAVGAASSVDALMRAYRADIGEMTLDQMSEKAMEEHFGAKIEPMSVQNVFVSAWRALHGWVTSPDKWLGPLNRAFREEWCVAFGYVDVVMVATLLGVRFTSESVGVLCDCVKTVARLMGREQAVARVQAFLDQVNWQQDKATKFWVTTQDATKLDFQAACIDIVETFVNVFGTDYAADMQPLREKALVPDDVLEELAANAALPVSDFLSEVKLFLGRFNCHTRRLVAAASLLSAFHHESRHVDQQQKQRMIHMLKEEFKEAPPAVRQLMEFALTPGVPETIPIPLMPIDGTGIREGFDAGHIDLPTANGNVRVNRLASANGAFDFSPIHGLMDLQHPGEEIVDAMVYGPSYISPDDRGARLQFALVQHVSARGGGAALCPTESMLPWYLDELARADLPPVRKILVEAGDLFRQDSTTNWIAHITGLAMGGKSKGTRSWVNVNDLIVVPTRELKAEWQENLGKLDPVRRATVVTQHEALAVKYAARYVLVDECYAFAPQHLQAIANRQHRSRGIITIGDKRQIGNVFTPEEYRVDLMISECPCRMITPTTFVGWDAAVVYLANTTSDVHVDQLFVGSDNCTSLRYTLPSVADDVLLPGQGDIAIQGTQKGKEMIRTRGLEGNTVHECQGRRSGNTILHTAGRTLGGDLRWLSLPEQRAHLGVAVTRARGMTVFVVDGVEALTPLPWYDAATVNGTLSDTLMLGGTSWDLVEPRTESESVWRHVHAPNLVESGLVETPLTDPVTVGTVFCQGEPLSKSEITTNVELVGSICFRDDFLETSRDFDSYTYQPREVPGADMVQALTRAVADVRPTPQDFVDAEQIVEWLFAEVIDKKLFFAHVNNSRRAALKRQTRQQVIDGCYANVENAASVLSFGFLKPEFAKKPTEMVEGPCELKAQGVVSASDMQQAVFADACDSLTHAWARSMRKGKLSPVGLREEEVEDFLSTFERSYELDIEKQDSSHKPVHIIVASIFIQMAADKLGLGTIAAEIRNERKVRMMGAPFKFVLNKSLASGDPWTLIINKIMAYSSLISVADLTDVRICQSGDDVTMDREPPWRKLSLRDQLMANKGLTWKVEERDQRKNGVTFISRAVLPHRTVVYKALRTILKYGFRKRNSIQHAGIAADSKRVEGIAARWGLQAYAEARALVWGGDPVVIFDLWTRALAIARTPFDDLPDDLKAEDPRFYTVRERDGGCFGYALANCVAGNVQAINAIASYRGPVSISTALQACRDNKVSCIVMNERWALRSKARLINAMDRRRLTRSFVVVYEDHAVAVVPNTITLHSGFGKRQVTWKSSDSKDVEITEFE